MDIKSKKNSYILIGVSILVLNACMPDEADMRNQASSNNIDTKVELYSQSFQQYSNRSLSAFVNSANWQLQTVSEGPINLADAAYGSLNTGASEGYLSSAYCRDTGGSHYHLTWFDTSNSDGDTSLKGLGNANSGLVASHIKKLVSGDALASANGGDQLEFLDKSTITLSGTCAGAISIPEGAAVAAYKLQAPAAVTQNTAKTVMRAQPCSATGEMGTMTQKITALYMDDGTIKVGGATYSNETDLMASSDPAWQNISNCQSQEMQMAFNTSDSTASAIDTSVMGTGSVVKDALQTHLTNIRCQEVKEKQSMDANDPNATTSEFDTCEQGETIDLMGNALIKEIKEEEEMVTYSCMSRTGPPAVTLNKTYKGIPGKYYGLTATNIIRPFGADGEITLKKITTTYNVRTDDGENLVDKEASSVKLIGEDINCEANDDIRLSCNEIYGSDPKIDTITGTGPEFTSTASITGWDNVNTPTPNSTQHSSWAYKSGSMSCDLERERTTPCGTTEYSTALVTNPTQKLSWSAWEDTNGKQCLAFITGSGDLDITSTGTKIDPSVGWFAAQTFTGSNIAAQRAAWESGALSYWNTYKNDYYKNTSNPNDLSNLQNFADNITYSGMVGYLVPGQENLCTKIPVGRAFDNKVLEIKNYIEPFVAKHHKLGTLDLNLSDTTGVVPGTLKYKVDYIVFNKDPDDPQHFDYTYEMSLAYDVSNKYALTRNIAILDGFFETIEKAGAKVKSFIDSEKGGYTNLTSDLNTIANKFRNDLLAVPHMNPSSVNVTSSYNPATGTGTVLQNGKLANLGTLNASQLEAFNKAITEAENTKSIALFDLYKDKHKLFDIMGSAAKSTYIDSVQDSLYTSAANLSCNMLIEYDGKQRFSSYKLY